MSGLFARRSLCGRALSFRSVAFSFPWFGARRLAADTAPGIPVKSELVKSACGACHEQDDAGRMTRISYERKTPEAWELTLKRMMRTGRVQLSPEQAKGIIRYLGDDHGLAPAEARAVLYRAEKRPKLEKAVNDEVGETCNRCHLAAWYLSQRRTKEEWLLLKGMHLGYFPIIEYQTFRGTPPGEQGGDDVPRAPSAAPPHDRRAVRTRGGGSTGSSTGLRRTIRSRPRSGRSIARRRARWTFPGSGSSPAISRRKASSSGTVTFEKTAAGYATRGGHHISPTERRRNEREPAFSTRTSPGAADRKERLSPNSERFWLSRTTGALSRGVSSAVTTESSVSTCAWSGSGRMRASPESPRRRSRRRRLRDVDPSGRGREFPSGRRRPRHRSRAGVERYPHSLSGAGPTRARGHGRGGRSAGRRNVRVGGTTALDALAVYDRIDYVLVRPQEGLARTGGGAIAKQFIQFEAVSFGNGPDGDAPHCGRRRAQPRIAHLEPRGVSRAATRTRTSNTWAPSTRTAISLRTSTARIPTGRERRTTWVTSGRWRRLRLPGRAAPSTGGPTSSWPLPSILIGTSKRSFREPCLSLRYAPDGDFRAATTRSSFHLRCSSSSIPTRVSCSTRSRGDRSRSRRLTTDSGEGEILRELASIGAVHRPGPALIPLASKSLAGRSAPAQLPRPERHQ